MAESKEKRRSSHIIRFPERQQSIDQTTSGLRRRSSSTHRKSSASQDSDGGILHLIPADLQIPQMNFSDQYDIEKTIAEGCFAKILLAAHRPTHTTVVLKAIHTELTSYKEFLKEFHYSYQLSHHHNIISAYNVAFRTKDYFVFAQEYAPYGDLAANVGSNGLDESSCKLIAEQLSSALGFMHLKNLVHRDLKLENVLIFAPDFSRIKLCDFGATTKKGMLVYKIRHTWASFIPPEILEIVKNERFICKISSDSWQFGILLFTILTGSPPWKSADSIKDSQYSAFLKYQKKKTTKIPDNFRKFTTRFIRCFRKYLDHDPNNRAKVTEVIKYMKDRWMECKLTGSKSAILLSTQAKQDCDQDSVCVYLNNRGGSRFSLDENKTRLRRLMSSYGLETTLDQNDVRKRILDWLSSCDSSAYDEDIECF